MMHRNSKINRPAYKEPGQFALFSLAFVVLTVAMTEYAHAMQVGVALCNMVSAVMGGGVGSAIATAGVLMASGSAAMGRMSWSTAITVSVGIAFMFSAGTVAMELGAGESCFG
jgi:type IV secretory pathway VirB2 component (pilin)